MNKIIIAVIILAAGVIAHAVNTCGVLEYDASVNIVYANRIAYFTCADDYRSTSGKDLAEIICDFNTGKWDYAPKHELMCAKINREDDGRANKKEGRKEEEKSTGHGAGILYSGIGVLALYLVKKGIRGAFSKNVRLDERNMANSNMQLVTPLQPDTFGYQQGRNTPHLTASTKSGIIALIQPIDPASTNGVSQVPVPIEVCAFCETENGQTMMTPAQNSVALMPGNMLTTTSSLNALPTTHVISMI